jgi:TonB-dependent receptor
MSRKHLHESCAQVALWSALALGSLAAAPAFGQENDASNTDDSNAIVVTGYRASLTSSAVAKRNSVTVGDSVFAEDIGKFTDSDIAEALSRVPGVQITRNVNGEGVLISVRGLGTDFTKIMLDGAQVAVASSGTVDSQNQNREVDLSIFPTEMFTRLDVQKTPRAANLEGGVAGIVNMRAARPFDFKESQLTYSLQGSYGSTDGGWSKRGNVMGSWRQQTGLGEIGLLGGVSLVRNDFYTTGFETIGWTNPNLTAAQCGVGNTCNGAGGNGWTIPASVPTTGNVGLGLAPGLVLNNAQLLALNPGLTTAQLDNALIPRLGRNAVNDGERNRDAAVASLQWRPSSGNAEFHLDWMGIQTDRHWNRADMDWVGRSGSAIPVGLKVDSNNVVTSGQFANAQFFLEDRPYTEQIHYMTISPGGTYDITDNLQLNVEGNWSRSMFWRYDPTVLVNTPLGVGTTVNYANPGEPFPSIVTNANLNDPNAGWTWAGGRVNLSQEKRVTFTKGAHADVRWGDDVNNIRAGFAWDDIGRSISPRNNDAAWQLGICGSPCTGATGLIPQSALSSYILPGPAGFIVVDTNRFLQNSNYAALSATAAVVGSADTAATTGSIEEDTKGVWIEGNGRFDIFNRPLTYNVGVRQIHTDQTTQGFGKTDGVTFIHTGEGSYDATLPAANFAYDVLQNVKLRFAVAQTITRPNPSQILPSGTSNTGGLPFINFSDPSAQSATQGNPGLQPYKSNNFDAGIEWYTGGEGYVALEGFKRDITGFTSTNVTSYTLGDLHFDTRPTNPPNVDLSGTQLQTLLNTYKNLFPGDGPAFAGFPNWLATAAQQLPITVAQQANGSKPLTIEGYEATWVQPLDFLTNGGLTKGLGFSTNYTNVAQRAVPPTSPALGIARYTYNLTGYYERFGGSLRVSYTYQAGSVASGPNQNGIAPAAIYNDPRGQLDLSAAYTFAKLPSQPQLTLDVTNITQEPIRTYFEFHNATYTYYQPGYNIIFGFRGTF